jgi:hypothetical protein
VPTLDAFKVVPHLPNINLLVEIRDDYEGHFRAASDATESKCGIT